jgi:hypothetical protein
MSQCGKDSEKYGTFLADLPIDSDGDFGKYFHLPVSVNFGKWILFTG